MTIEVGPAGKVGDGVSAHHVFQVTSDLFSVELTAVNRRYSDFLWLHGQLLRQCEGCIIPPLPAKVVPLLQGDEFLTHRRVGLERFLRKVSEHEELKKAPTFRAFLISSPVELTALKAEAQATSHGVSGNGIGGGGGLGPNALAAQMAHKGQQLNSWWGKAYQRIAENDKVKLLAAKTGRDLRRANTIEDPAFERTLKYVTQLHTLAKGMQARAQNALRQNQLAAGAYCELIEGMNTLADVEDAHDEDSSAAVDYSAVLALLDTRARLMDSELTAFAESADYFARWVGAVVNAINAREERRFVYQAKLAARNKHSENGNGEQQTSNNTSLELAEAKQAFESVHARVVREVARFQTEKGTEIRNMFAQYAALQRYGNTEVANILSTTSRHLLQPDNCDGDEKKAQCGGSAPRFIPTKTYGTPPDNNEANELEDTIRSMSVRPDSTVNTKAAKTKTDEQTPATLPLPSAPSMTASESDPVGGTDDYADVSL